MHLEDQPQRRSQWQSHLGWDDVANVNESRRHSLADIPTRRGSIVGADARGNGGEFWPDSYEWEASRDPRNEQYQLQYQRDSELSFVPLPLTPQIKVRRQARLPPSYSDGANFVRPPWAHHDGHASTRRHLPIGSIDVIDSRIALAA